MKIVHKIGTHVQFVKGRLQYLRGNAPRRKRPVSSLGAAGLKVQPGPRDEKEAAHPYWAKTCHCCNEKPIYFFGPLATCREHRDVLQPYLNKWTDKHAGKGRWAGMSFAERGRDAAYARRYEGWER